MVLLLGIVSRHFFLSAGHHLLHEFYPLCLILLTSLTSYRKSIQACEKVLRSLCTMYTKCAVHVYVQLPPRVRCTFQPIALGSPCWVWDLGWTHQLVVSRCGDIPESQAYWKRTIIEKSTNCIACSPWLLYATDLPNPDSGARAYSAPGLTSVLH